MEPVKSVYKSEHLGVVLVLFLVQVMGVLYVGARNAVMNTIVISIGNKSRSDCM